MTVTLPATAGISHDLLRNMYGYSLPNHTDYRLEPSQDSQVVGAEYVQCYDYKSVTVPIAWEVLRIVLVHQLASVCSLCTLCCIICSIFRSTKRPNGLPSYLCTKSVLAHRRGISRE